MVRVRLVCSPRVDSVHPVRFRRSPCFRLHWISDNSTDDHARSSDPGSKNASARPHDSLFSSGMFAVGSLPQRLVLLYVAYPISTSADALDSPSNPSSFQVLASIPEVRTSGESTSAVIEKSALVSQAFNTGLTLSSHKYRIKGSCI